MNNIWFFSVFIYRDNVKNALNGDIVEFVETDAIGSQQTHRKRRLHRIDLQEDRGELCIEIQRERISHLANNYGPEGLW